MKVLQINATIGRGSVGRIVNDIYHELKKAGHECKVAFGRGEIKGIEKSDAIRIGNENEVRLHALISRITDKAGFYFPKSTQKLIEKIENYQPDIIHMHGNYGYYINIEVLLNYMKDSGIPVVNTLHSCWDFTGHCCYFDYIGCNRWKTGCEHCPQKKEYPKSYFFDNSKFNYQMKKKLFSSLENMVIVTPSYWLANLVEKSFLSKYPVKVINNGIDTEIFKPTKGNFRERYNCKEKKIILGIANVWDRRKGLETFIELSKYLTEDYQIVLIGLSKMQLRKLPKTVIGITHTNNPNELAEIYTTADIFLNPTLEDNYPTTNLEALSCGTPVIGFNVGGIPEQLDMNRGIIVETGNVHKIIESIRYYDNRTIEEKNKLKEASIEWIRCFNTRQKMAKCYIELYNKNIR